MNSQSLPHGSASIRPFVLSLSAAARAVLKQQQPCCLWLTGLSGSGKSTLANALEVQLNEQGRHTFVLDGDNLRTGLCSDLGMNDAARKENIRRIGEVARLMVDAGLIVIVSAISRSALTGRPPRRCSGLGSFLRCMSAHPLRCARGVIPKACTAQRWTDASRRSPAWTAPMRRRWRPTAKSIPMRSNWPTPWSKSWQFCLKNNQFSRQMHRE